MTACELEGTDYNTCAHTRERSVYILYAARTFLWNASLAGSCHTDEVWFTLLHENTNYAGEMSHNFLF